jgi:3-dehydroquinate synthase
MATATLSISFQNNARCEIFIGEGMLSRIPRRFFSDTSSIFVISDSVVSKLYGRKLESSLSRIAPSHSISFTHGERSKSLLVASNLASKLSDLGADRKSAIVALGGGVVGDLAGFVASIYKRGVRYCQAPTTLLAQVDSSIGGKTGVDTDWGKNQLGTFYQPEAVFIDPSTLDSLPRKELINGLAEIIKSAVIADRNMFDAVSKENLDSVQELKRFIPNTCRIKAKVVEADERERGLRSVLNYGHTVGHAIEAASKFRMSHGYSVTLGMIAEGWIARKMGVFLSRDYEKQQELLGRVRKNFGSELVINPNKVLAFARLDKKSSKGTIRMSLPERIGRMSRTREGSYMTPVSNELLLSSLGFLFQ